MDYDEVGGSARPRSARIQRVSAARGHIPTHHDVCVPVTPKLSVVRVGVVSETGRRPGDQMAPTQNKRGKEVHAFVLFLFCFCF